MRMTIKVIPKSGRQEVKIEGDKAKVWLRSVPAGGKANDELVRVLAKYFDVAASTVIIRSGLSSKNKIVDIVGVNEDRERKTTP